MELSRPDLLVEGRRFSRGRIIAVSRNAVHEFSKRRVARLSLIEGHGIEGDAHAGAYVRHRYLAKRQPSLANLRQVHLMTSELLQKLQADGYEVMPGDLGENVTTEGLDLERLPLATRLVFGKMAVIELTGLRTPCALIDRFRSGLKRRLIKKKGATPRFEAGVMATVLKGGHVAPGDAIDVVLPAQPHTVLPAL
jgi:MOSC domain-containing protein YiiM